MHSVSQAPAMYPPQLTLLAVCAEFVPTMVLSVPGVRLRSEALILTVTTAELHLYMKNRLSISEVWLCLLRRCAKHAPMRSTMHIT
eukprot:m.96262 g.96262  ORF g.96262 m.96262 type:complete len:86 (-) comp16642_c0_seq1:16-273(-)